MRAAPDGLDVSAVVAGLRDSWEYEAAGVDYAPVGGGSYHWLAADSAPLVRLDDRYTLALFPFVEGEPERGAGTQPSPID